MQSKFSRNLWMVSPKRNCSHSLENYVWCNRLGRGIFSSAVAVGMANLSFAGRDAPAGNQPGFSPLLFSG